MENNNVNYFFICIQYLYLYCMMEQKWKKLLMNKCQKLKKTPYGKQINRWFYKNSIFNL